MKYLKLRTFMNPAFTRIATRTALLILGCGAPPAAAQALPAHTCDSAELYAQSLADPARIAVADGRISLVPPRGSRVLHPDEIARRPSQEQGLMILRNGDGTTVNLAYTEGGPSEDAAGVDVIAGTLDIRSQIMGHRIRWIKRGEPVTLEGIRWLLFEYAQEQADRRDRYVRVYWTAFQDRGLRVEFDAPYTRRAQVARSAETLQVRDCALASGANADPAGGQPVSSAARTCDQTEIRAQLAADTGRVAIGGGRVTLVPPPRMQMLQRSEAETIFVDSTGVAVAVSFRQDVPILDSPAYREAIERRLETGFQQLEWISRDVVDIGGTRWLRMEFTASTDGRATRQVYYLAPFQEGGVGLAQVSLASAYPHRAAELAASAATVKLNDCR